MKIDITINIDVKSESVELMFNTQLQKLSDKKIRHLVTTAQHPYAVTCKSGGTHRQHHQPDNKSHQDGIEHIGKFAECRLIQVLATSRNH